MISRAPARPPAGRISAAMMAKPAQWPSPRCAAVDQQQPGAGPVMNGRAGVRVGGGRAGGRQFGQHGILQQQRRGAQGCMGRDQQVIDFRHSCMGSIDELGLADAEMLETRKSPNTCRRIVAGGARHERCPPPACRRRCRGPKCVPASVRRRSACRRWPEAWRRVLGVQADLGNAVGEPVAGTSIPRGTRGAVCRGRARTGWKKVSAPTSPSRKRERRQGPPGDARRQLLAEHGRAAWASAARRLPARSSRALCAAPAPARPRRPASPTDARHGARRSRCRWSPAHRRCRSRHVGPASPSASRPSPRSQRPVAASETDTPASPSVDRRSNAAMMPKASR